MDTETKPRMSKETVQQIIDSRLAAILEKELSEETNCLQGSGKQEDSLSSKPFGIFKKQEK